ncbi:MAG TPA: multicopper oxidase family protein [Gemmatimonadaceae bacterium]
MKIAASLVLGLPIALAASRPPLPSACDGSVSPLAPSRDLYCIELIAAPRIAGASGRVALLMRPGPFTVDVTASGVLRFSPVIELAGLPAPASLGPYSTYVAWVATPVMDPVLRLGEVRNGRAQLPVIALDKFVILVTAEASAMVNAPTGRIVLRGASPSTRLQPPDLMQFTIGASHERESHPMEHVHAAPKVPRDSARWTTVPMPPNIQMLPAEMTLRPTVAPYLPRSHSATPHARPRELVHLKTGDTLRLRAGLVRRAFKDQTLTMYAFNDQYPGPLLDIQQGAEITVELTNALDQPTTVHWHGVRLDNRFDGTPDLTQQPVPPGGHFTYHLRFPDAGIYWYHPHVREDIQQELGLYGNILVRSPRPDYFSPAHREEILMLDDLLVNDDGLVPFGADTATHALMGRFGNVMLVNGEPRYSLSVKKGEVVRFYLTNVSNTRTFNLSFPGARMKVVAGDVSNFEREAWVESVVISPAERYVVHVKFDSAGAVPVLNRVQSLDHLFGKFYYETDTLGMVRVAAKQTERNLEASFASLREDSATQRDIERYRPQFGREPDKALILAVDTHDLPFFTQQIMRLDSIYFTPIEWTGTMPGMNWASTGREVRWVVRDAATGKENMDIDWSFRRGDVVKVRIVNERQSLHAMQHPIHIHGQRFLVLAVNGVPTTNRAWKDTVLVPVGFTVDLLVDLSNPGRWMLHCHIAEHLTSAMMMAFTVQ